MKYARLYTDAELGMHFENIEIDLALNDYARPRVPRTVLFDAGHSDGRVLSSHT